MRATITENIHARGRRSYVLQKGQQVTVKSSYGPGNLNFVVEDNNKNQYHIYFNALKFEDAVLWDGGTYTNSHHILLILRSASTLITNEGDALHIEIGGNKYVVPKNHWIVKNSDGSLIVKNKVI